MKILIVHTFYQQSGGEDMVVAQEEAMLAKNNEVRVFSLKNNGGIKGALQFFASVWNLSAAKEIRNVVQEFKPDAVHIHNLHYAIGPLVIRYIKREKVKVVVTLHNYRMLCPSGILMHNGKIFTDSVYASFPWKAVFKKVYRNSYFQTFWLAFISWVHNVAGTWNKVDQYITLTESAKKLFLQSKLNIDKCKFVVKPNFVKQETSLSINECAKKAFLRSELNADKYKLGVKLNSVKQETSLSVMEYAKTMFLESELNADKYKLGVKLNSVKQETSLSTNRTKAFLFIGRLASEKGIHVLLKAFEKLPYQLRIAGDGPLKDDVIAAQGQGNIRYLGKLNKDGIAKELHACDALIFPSIWFEGMPMTIIEAFSNHNAVIASNLGAMQSMIKDGHNGLLFTSNSPEDLKNVIIKWKSFSETEKETIRENAFDNYINFYSEEVNYENLMSVYQQ